MTVKCGFIRIDQSIQETVQFYKRLGMSKATAISKTAGQCHITENLVKEVVK